MAVDELCEIANQDGAILQGSAYDLFTSHTVVCQAYNSAFELIMNELGIPQISVTGIKYLVSGGLPHAWSRVYVNGKWKNVDVTWSDDNGNSNSKYCLFDPALENEYGYILREENKDVVKILQQTFKF